MTKRFFDVRVKAPGMNTDELAIAEASRYLAYADHTDSYGIDSQLVNVEVLRDTLVEIRFMKEIPEGSEGVVEVLDGIRGLAHVVSIEEIAKPQEV